MPRVPGHAGAEERRHECAVPGGSHQWEHDRHNGQPCRQQHWPQQRARHDHHSGHQRHQQRQVQHSGGAVAEHQRRPTPQVEENGRLAHVLAGRGEGLQPRQRLEHARSVVAHVLQRARAGRLRHVKRRVVHVSVAVEGHVHAGQLRLHRALLTRGAGAVVAVDAVVGVPWDQSVLEDVLCDDGHVRVGHALPNHVCQPRIPRASLEHNGGAVRAHCLQVDERDDVLRPWVASDEAVCGLKKALLCAVEVEHDVPLQLQCRIVHHHTVHLQHNSDSGRVVRRAGRAEGGIKVRRDEDRWGLSLSGIARSRP
mmetsp:Transcript_3365/g.10570  ORF Transcript_3365/g.10570 Transcript_3365/m.10570 type:complete len:311 (+) Transcript_3365:1295-2227(+)